MGEQLIFISYRNLDWPLTHRVQEHLERGFDGEIYIDRKISSDDYERELLAKLRRCTVFILVVTVNTFDEARVAGADDWIRREVALALSLDKPIVLVLFEGRQPPHADRLPVDLQGIVTKQGVKFYAEYFEQAVEQLQRQCVSVAPGLAWSPARRRRPTDTTQDRRLEAAMPVEVEAPSRTEVRVKLSRIKSRGLKGELPAVLASGDEITKDDVRHSKFPIAFPTDEDGVLLPAILCVSVVAEHYDVEFATYPDSTCDGLAEVELSPTSDSRTVIFDLMPRGSDASSLGSSKVWIKVFHRGRPIAELSLGTTRVGYVPELAYVVGASAVPLGAALEDFTGSVAIRPPSVAPPPDHPYGSQGGYGSTPVDGPSPVGAQPDYGQQPSPQFDPLTDEYIGWDHGAGTFDSPGGGYEQVGYGVPPSYPTQGGDYGYGQGQYPAQTGSSSTQYGQYSQHGQAPQFGQPPPPLAPTGSYTPHAPSRADSGAWPKLILVAALAVLAAVLIVAVVLVLVQ